MVRFRLAHSEYRDQRTRCPVYRYIPNGGVPGTGQVRYRAACPLGVIQDRPPVVEQRSARETACPTRVGGSTNLLDHPNAVVQAAEQHNRNDRDGQPAKNPLGILHFLVLVFPNAIREAIKHGNLPNL